jgi:hypothetical protein
LPFNANVCVREMLEDLEWPAEIKNHYDLIISLEAISAIH